MRKPARADLTADAAASKAGDAPLAPVAAYKTILRDLLDRRSSTRR